MNDTPWCKPGDELSNILRPISPSVFVADYFAKQPLHIKGDTERFAKLFDLKALWRSLENPAAKELLIRVVTRERDEFQTIAPSVEVVQSLHSHGATICIADISLVDSKLTALAGAVRSQLNYAGQVTCNCYYSSDGEGFNTHFDVNVATTLQISGHKKWIYGSRPAVSWPDRDECAPTGVDVYEGGRKEVVLAPGDVLCLPAGTWHSARAVGSSLAINLAFGRFDFWDFMTAVMAPKLRRSGHAPPPVVLADRHVQIVMPRQVSEYFDEQLATLRHELAAVDSSTPTLQQAWKQMTVAESEGIRYNPDRVPTGTIEPDSPLRVAREAPIGIIQTHDDSGAPFLQVFYKNSRTSLPVQMLPFMTCLLDSTEFLAGEAVTWTGDDYLEYRWNDTQLVLVHLRGAGIIKSASDANGQHVS